MKSKICVVLFAVANFVRYYLCNVVDSDGILTQNTWNKLQECRRNYKGVYKM